MSNNSASMRAAGVPQPFSDALLPSGLFFLLVPASRNAAAGWSEACMPCKAAKAQRWERRLGGLLEGEGGGMKGRLQSQNHAAGCGGHDGARCELVERRSWGSAPPPSSRRSTLLSETTPFFATDS